MSWSAIAAMFGLALSVGPALVAHTFPEAAALQQLGPVVLGGLIAMRACRRRRSKVAVTAQDVASKRNDSAVEQIVGRLSLEPHVTAVTWQVDRAIPEA